MVLLRRKSNVISDGSTCGINVLPEHIDSSDRFEFLCGSCGMLLLHAAEHQVQGVLIHCTECGATNTAASGGLPDHRGTVSPETSDFSTPARTFC
jgi:predicted RNA-binding Zn-ribbon protein involved in translation (DUF1610 family)